MAVVVRSKFARLAKADKRIMKLEKMREEGIFSINTDRLLDELETLHMSRKVRVLSTSEILQAAQKKLLDVTTENVAIRGSCVTTKLKAYRAGRLLEEKLKAAENYLNVKYASVLAEEYRTKDQKTAAIHDILKDFYGLQHRLKTVETMADLVIQDCDQTGYGISAMSRAIEISFARERNV